MTLLALINNKPTQEGILGGGECSLKATEARQHGEPSLHPGHGLCRIWQ